MLEISERGNLPSIDRKFIRQFAIASALFFATAAVLSKSLPLAIIGSSLVVGGILFPDALKQPLRILMTLVHPMGVLFSKLLLFFLFYFIITPIAWGMRLMRRDALRLRFQSEVPTYWDKISPVMNVEDYFHQS